jgi:hypothetical protein
MWIPYAALDVREWYRRAPLHREWKARAVAFRTELDWVRYWPDSEMKRLTDRAGRHVAGRRAVRMIPGLNDYFRAPRTTIEVSRDPLRIYGSAAAGSGSSRGAYGKTG